KEKQGIGVERKVKQRVLSYRRLKIFAEQAVEYDQREVEADIREEHARYIIGSERPTEQGSNTMYQQRPDRKEDSISCETIAIMGDIDIGNGIPMKPRKQARIDIERANMCQCLPGEGQDRGTYIGNKYDNEAAE